MPNSLILFLQEPRKPGSGLSKEVKPSDKLVQKGCTPGSTQKQSTTSRNIKIIWLVTSVSRPQGKWEAP